MIHVNWAIADIILVIIVLFIDKIAQILIDRLGNLKLTYTCMTCIFYHTDFAIITVCLCLTMHNPDLSVHRYI